MQTSCLTARSQAPASLAIDYGLCAKTFRMLFGWAEATQLFSRFRGLYRQIRAWNEDRKAWNAEHCEAWAPVTKLDADGLSPHQKECERRVVAKLSQNGLKLSNRHFIPDALSDYSSDAAGTNSSEREVAIVADLIEASAKFWFYIDQTDIAAPSGTLRLEGWDTKTPEEHYDEVLKVVEALMLEARDKS